MDAAPQSNGAPQAAPVTTELPTVESPPLSPAGEVASVVADAHEPAIEPLAAAAAPATRPRLVLKLRHKRYAVIAASATFAAAFGAVVGAWAGGAWFVPAHPDLAATEQNKTMQQSIARLGKEVTVLKASLDQATRSAHAQVLRPSERLDRAADITGSVPAQPAASAQSATPLPSPRPAARAAAMDMQPPARAALVPGWTIRATRNGYVYVENRGDIYQVMPGVPLPGLGPVQSVMRQDGRWMVVTPKGIIVSVRNRRYYEDF